jgi:hypothetical protein
VALAATTAQLTATVLDVGADGNVPFNPVAFDLPDASVGYQGPFVTLQILYISGDDTPLDFQVGPVSASSNLSSIDTQTGSMGPVYTKIVGPGILVFPPTLGLVPTRTHKVTLAALASPGAVSGQGTATIEVTALNFPLTPYQTTFNYVLSIP